MIAIDAMLSELPVIGDRTRAQLDDLLREPTEARAELMVQQLEGAASYVRRLSEELRRRSTRT